MLKLGINHILLLCLAIAMGVSSCSEEGPLIILDPPQETLLDTCFISTTPVTAELKSVLFEEFSGVKCANCAAGNAETHDLVVAYGERLVPVTIHSKFLADPYTGDVDLRNDDADEIANTFGPVGIKPSCFISRRIVGGQRLNTAIGSWASAVAVEMNETSPVNLDVAIIEYDAVERTFQYETTLSYSGGASNHSLGFLLTENEIFTQQLNGNNVLMDYEHEYVLRKAITPIVGEPIIGCDLLVNTVVIKRFELDLDDTDYDPSESWNMEHMELVAFVRQDDDVIVTAAKVKITP